jgi:hypothetical protein
MRRFPVSTRVNAVSNDDPAALCQLTAYRQPGMIFSNTRKKEMR